MQATIHSSTGANYISLCSVPGSLDKVEKNSKIRLFKKKKKKDFPYSKIIHTVTGLTRKLGKKHIGTEPITEAHTALLRTHCVR